MTYLCIIKAVYQTCLKVAAIIAPFKELQSNY